MTGEDERDAVGAHGPARAPSRGPAGALPSLLVEQDRLVLRLRGLEVDMAELVEASRDSNADDEHDPEGQTIGYERAQLASLTASTRRRLAEVDAALQRVGTGDHGRCASCGEPIGADRLEARPTARTCVGCARLQERG